MDRSYWHRQQPGKPLFPDLLWSRPENRAQAGKLLVAGGNLHSFSAPAQAYAEAGKAGAGTTRVLLPDSLQRTVGRVFEAGEYAPSTPSGSFGRQALAELLAMSRWADGVLLAGNFGRNSETAILLEKFGQEYGGQLTVTHDAADYFIPSPYAVLARPHTLFVISFAQLQKLAVQARFGTPFTFNMDFLHLVDALHEFTTEHTALVVTKHLQTLFVAAAGRVSTTKLTDDAPVWRVRTATHAAVWWFQNPDSPYQALTTAALDD